MLNTALISHPTVTYALPLTRNYVSQWGLKESVRELVQNAIDSDSPFEFDFTDGTLTISSRLASLDASTLVLGATSKADDGSKIGSFGEGYKLALLVIKRLGYPVHVMNNGRLWTPRFMHSATFGIEVFAIDERPFMCNGLSFVIGDLSDDEIEGIRESCLQMQPPITDAIETPQGQILQDHPGKLYVGGLFVCKTPLEHGYNIKPQYLHLERDRQTVSTFDLQWITKDMWFSTKQFERIATMITADVPDLKYAEHGCPELLKEACYKQFMASNPNGVIAKSPEDLKELVSRGIERVVYINSTLHACVTGAANYQPTLERAKAPTPTEIITAWFAENREYMSTMPIVAFKQLLGTSGSWRTH
jgi:hypothetical protein